MKKYYFLPMIISCVLIICMLPSFYATDCDYSDDPERCEAFYDSPTADSLEAIPDPTPEDFAYLISENRDGAIEYLMVNYRSDFAEQLVSTSDFRDKDERAIAQQYYAEDDQHINDNPSEFTEFLQQEGVDIKGINGPVKGYTTSGTLTGAHQQINVNDFKKSPLKDKYALEVTPSGDIIVIPKSKTGEAGTSVHFTGTLKGDASGKFTLQSGTIQDIPVKYGYKLEFDTNGNLVSGNVNEFNGIVFSGPTPIKVSFERYWGSDEHVIVIQVHEATVVSIEDDYDLPDIEMFGSASFPSSGEGIDRSIYIPAGQKLIVNGYQITSSSSTSTEVKLGDPAWYESYLSSAEDTLAGVFGLPAKKAPSAQIGEESLTLEGDGVVADFDANAFVAGTEQPALPTTESDLSTLRESSHIYKKGDTGDGVIAIQTMLMEQIDPETNEPYLPATYTIKLGQVIVSNDGVFGVATDAALRAWQVDNGLVVDGKFGKNSRAKTYELYASDRHMTSSVTTGYSGRAVVTREGDTLVLNGQEIRVNLGSDAVVIEDGETYVQPTDKPQETPDVAVEVISRAEDGSSSEETSLVGAVVDTGGYAARRVVGEVSAIGVSIIDGVITLAGVKPDSPLSIRYFQHYLEGTGEDFILPEEDIPEEWKTFIIEYTKQNKPSSRSDCPGICYDDVSSYNQDQYELQNAIGHFNVEIIDNSDGSKTYTIVDYYQFGQPDTEMKTQARHSFPLNELSDEEITQINEIIPDIEFTSADGEFKDKFEVERRPDGPHLVVPQPLLQNLGTNYHSRASFVVKKQG